MADAEEIALRVAEAGSRAQEASLSLEYEASEDIALLQRLQATFGDQQAGQEAVSRLYAALRCVLAAGTALRDAKGHGDDLVARILS